MTRTKVAEITRQLKLDQISIIKANYIIKLKPTIQIKTSKDIYNHLLNNWDLETIDLQEEFKIILLNRFNYILGISTIGVGSKDGVIIDKQKIMAMAIITNTSAIITAHNHPSSNLSPSEQDKVIYKELLNSCKLMSVCYLDNLIVTRNGYFSFADEGIN